MRPVVAPEGTTAVIWVSLLTTNCAAAPGVKETDVALVKPVPVMMTCEPTIPAVGARPETVGGPTTVKVVVVVAVPPGVVTLMKSGPMGAPAGTKAVIVLSALTTNAAMALPILTELAAVNP